MIIAIICTLIAKLRIISAFLFGLAWMASVGHWYTTWQMPEVEIAKINLVEGEVLSIIRQPDDIRFTLKVSSVNQQQLSNKVNVRLSWKVPTVKVRQGQTLRLHVRLKPAYGLANEGGFHYQTWLLTENIIATGYIIQDTSNQLLDDQVTVRQQLVLTLSDYELVNEAWIAALGLGDRSLFTQADWQLIQNTGVAHLVAISGLHLAIVGSASYFLFSLLVRLTLLAVRVPQTINLRLWAVLWALLVTLLYAWLAGFSLPTVRAWIGILLYSFLIWQNRYWRAKHLILYSMLLFVLLFPLSLFSLSFWLSFSAVIVIALVFWRWPNPSAGSSFFTGLKVMIRLQLALSLLMLPLVAWQFGFVSLVSPVVNLIAVPVVTILLVPMCLVAIVLLILGIDWAVVVLSMIDKLMTWSIQFLTFASGYHYSAIDVPKIPFAAWVCLTLAVVVLLLPQLVYKKRFCLVLLVPFISYLIPVNSASWKLDVLDVGQGLSVVISKNRRALVYDVGASYPSGFNMADAVVLPFLKARGIKQIDWLIVSHFDNDHAGALPQLLDGIVVNQMISPRNHCLGGWQHDWQGLKIEALWPDTPRQEVKNNDSCVIRVSDQNLKVLLPGDIEGEAEQRIVERFGTHLSSTVLVAPHHGSNTSSSKAFIDAVSPQYTIFSEGFMNRWGFPKQRVVNRYVAEGSLLYSTSEQGQISMCFRCDDSQNVSVRTFRQDIHPYWYAN